MSRIPSDLTAKVGPLVALATLVVAPAHLAAQEPEAPPAPGSIRSSEIEISRDAAELRLELEGDRSIRLAIRDGRVVVNGREVGAASRGDALDRSWRELLTAAMEAPTTELASLLVDWQSPGEGPGARLDAVLEATLLGMAEAAPAPVAPAEQEVVPLPDAPAERAEMDTVDQLLDRIAELEERTGRLRAVEPLLKIDADQLERDIRRRVERELAQSRDRRPWSSPLRHVWRGISGVLGVLATYAVFVGLGFAGVFFGRPYLEGIADTARRATVRSAIVGVAGTFLILPVFIIGLIVLLISIVGIPALLAWVPLFPLAVLLALVVGYLAVAHAVGESLAERRFEGMDWFRHANSYYYVLTGMGVLLALFLAENAVSMAGPWLGFIQGILHFFGVILTWAALTIGFGAVLLSRAGTRPVTADGSPPAPSGDEERGHV